MNTIRYGLCSSGAIVERFAGARSVEQRFSAAVNGFGESALAAEVIMGKPFRAVSPTGTYFVTSSCYMKQRLLQTDRMASLFVEVLCHYRIQGKYLLHAFVVMPDHFHLLVTPGADITIERAMQFIKGGFSFRAKKELGFNGEIWQNSFYDRRVRDRSEFQRFREYIHQNPLRKGLALMAEEYAYSSAGSNICLDEVPQRLKPLFEAI